MAMNQAVMWSHSLETPSVMGVWFKGCCAVQRDHLCVFGRGGGAVMQFWGWRLKYRSPRAHPESRMLTLELSQSQTRLLLPETCSRSCHEGMMEKAALIRVALRALTSSPFTQSKLDLILSLLLHLSNSSFCHFSSFLPFSRLICISHGEFIPLYITLISWSFVISAFFTFPAFSISSIVIRLAP